MSQQRFLNEYLIFSVFQQQIGLSRHAATLFRKYTLSVRFVLLCCVETALQMEGERERGNWWSPSADGVHIIDIQLFMSETF